MPITLRPSILNEINKTLSNKRTHVNAHDFSITQGDGWLNITYNYKENIFIKFSFRNEMEEYVVNTERSHSRGILDTTTKEYKELDYIISGTMAPGNLTETETFIIYGTHSISRHVEKWVVNLWEDISSDPVIKGLNKQHQELEKYLQDFDFENVKNGNEFYTRTEAEEIKSKLNEIQNTFEQELKASIKDKELLKAELNELKKEFETIKQTIPNLTKKNWVKSTLTKLYVWGSKKKNQNLIKATVKYGNALLDKVFDS